MLNTEYWQGYVDSRDKSRYEGSDNSTPEYEEEYVKMQLPNGDNVRFKRNWGGHRFTDKEVEKLIAGMEIRIDTPSSKGVIGFLDWQEYKGYDYFGFAPWDAEEYSLDNAPFPVSWNNYEFTEEDEKILRSGDKLLILATSNRTGSEYALHVSFDIIDNRWGIVPHFEEFNMSGSDFSREDCLFTPMFGGKKFTQEEIKDLREGESIYFEGVSREGRDYKCLLSLQLDEKQDRWKLIPKFIY